MNPSSPASLRRMLVASTSIALSILLPGCQEDRGAGTNDETTTSLQILANNVRELPPMHDGISPPSPAAARAAGRAADYPRAVNWYMTEYVDHGSWASWRLHEQSGCTFDSSDPSLCRMRGRIHANGALGFLESEVFALRDGHGLVSIDMFNRMRNRSGFAWTARYQVEILRAGLDESSRTLIVRMEFPSLGLHVAYQGEERDGVIGFRDHLAAGLPVLTSDGRAVGYVICDSLSEEDSPALLWFDLERRPVPARETVFRPVAEDSLGVTVFGVRRDPFTQDVLVDGRFHLPASYGLFARDAFALASMDSARVGNGYPVFVSAPTPGRFTLRIPQGEGHARIPSPGWMRLGFGPRNVSDSLSNGHAILSRIFRIP